MCRCGRPARLCSGVLSGALEHVKRRVVRMCFVRDAGRCWVATAEVRAVGEREVVMAEAAMVAATVAAARVVAEKAVVEAETVVATAVVATESAIPKAAETAAGP